MNGYILFLGTGSKPGTPNLEHLFKNISSLKKGNKAFCEICENGIRTRDKNVRNPFSVILKNPINCEGSPENEHHETFLFEIGPTFRTSMLEHAIPAKISRIDSIFCMTSNESSFDGIDESREVQEFNKPISEDGILHYEPVKKIPTYMSSSAFHVFKDWYKYIMVYSISSNLASRTKVGCIQLNILDPKYSPKVLKIDSQDDLNKLLSSCEDSESKLINNYCDFLPISIEYSKDIRITALFFIDSDNSLSTGYFIEYHFAKGNSICIIPPHSIIPNGSMEFLKRIPEINTLIFPIIQDDDSEINQKSILSSIDFCANKIKSKNVYFYNINCRYSHDFVQNLLSENIHEQHGTNFTISFDSLILPI
ncbi:putative hydrolase [Cryptosporidium felis]|nr:putative hydrolase [Cryptosporidium felis]